MYDVIIIGAGPAGISASLYIKRANLNVLVIHNGKSSLENAKIENYYGFPNGIQGKELYNNGIKQANLLGVEIKELEVIAIENIKDGFSVNTVNGCFEAKSIIISTGNKKIKPNISGIKEFEGRGVSYCAICDAFFYRNKDIAVIGNGKFAINEANELKNVAKKITVLTNGLDIEECEFDVNNIKIKKINGSTKVESIEFEDGTSINIDGIFVALGEASGSDFAKTLGIIQEEESIKVNEKMETNIKGVYACGNTTGGLLQVCKAVYEGSVAGISAVQYIRENRKEN